MPSVQRFFKITTGYFSPAWADNDFRFSGTLHWDHQFSTEIQMQVDFAAGRDTKGPYVVLQNLWVDVYPTQRGFNFVCPDCLDHVRALYLPKAGGNFACRKCHRIHYVKEKALDVGRNQQRLKEALDETIVR